MSTRQLKLLDLIRDARGVSVDFALELHQTTFGSVCYRRWVVYDAGRERFVVSPEGREAHEEARDPVLQRRHNTGLFSMRVKAFHHNRARGAA